MDLVPDRGPQLLVGNHTLYGVQDAPLMVSELRARKGFLVRALGDHAHFAIPVWGDLLKSLGTVDGTRENCRRLLSAGEVVLVFPGGGREVMKRKGEKYRLIWKQRLGFVRMAIEHGAPIVPFGAVGGEDTFDIVLDGDTPLAAPLRPLIDRLGGRSDMLPPIARGVAGTALPRRQRFLFGFAPAIDTKRFAGREGDGSVLRRLRDQTRTAVEGQIADLLRRREQDL